MISFGNADIHCAACCAARCLFGLGCAMVLWPEMSLPQLLYRLEQDVRVKVIRIHNCKSPGEYGLLSGIPRRRMALASASDVRRRLWRRLFEL